MKCPIFRYFIWVFTVNAKVPDLGFLVFKVGIKPDFVAIRKAQSRVSTSSGNQGKPGKSLKKVPCMEKSWNSKKPE